MVIARQERLIPYVEQQCLTNMFSSNTCPVGRARSNEEKDTYTKPHAVNRVKPIRNNVA